MWIKIKSHTFVANCRTMLLNRVFKWALECYDSDTWLGLVKSVSLASSNLILRGTLFHVLWNHVLLPSTTFLHPLGIEHTFFLAGLLPDFLIPSSRNTDPYPSIFQKKWVSDNGEEIASFSMPSKQKIIDLLLQLTFIYVGWNHILPTFAGNHVMNMTIHKIFLGMFSWELMVQPGNIFRPF